MLILSPYRLVTSRRGSPGLPFDWEIHDAAGAEVTRSPVTFRSRHEAVTEGEKAVRALTDTAAMRESRDRRAAPRGPVRALQTEVAMEDVRERVSRVLAEQFQVPDERLTEAATLDRDLGATSLDLVEVVMSLEDEFSIDISDDEASRLNTVGDVLACVAAGVRRGASLRAPISQ